MSYYLRKHWKMNLLIFLLQLISSALIINQNIVLINSVQGIFDTDLHQFYFWMIVDTVLWIVIVALRSVLKWLKSRTIRSMNNDLRADIVASLLKKTHKEFHDQQSGEYMSWLTNDIGQIEELAWQTFFTVITTTTQIFFSIIALANMHWSLLVASLIVAVIIIYAPNLFSKKIKVLSSLQAQSQALATSKLKDLLAGLDVMRFFGKVNRFVADNKVASEMMEKPKFKLTYVQEIIASGIDVINILCQCVVLFLVGFLSINGFILEAAIMGCGNLCGIIYNGLASLGQLRLSILASKPYFEKITVHADELSGEEAAGPAPVEDAITVENLDFSYGGKPVLRNMNIRFEKGGKYALTGPSGCGKSTLLKLLLGWLPDYQGSIRFDNQDAKDFTPEQLQQQMSYIEQDVFLFNTTIRENITLGESFTEAQMNKALRDSALEYDLANMPQGLDTPVGEDGSCLSGGQKQRVAIARALIHNRSILLVDEGTSALDQKNADIVEKSLLNNPDLTLILVSHHLSEERKAQFDKVFQLESVTAGV